MSMRFSIGIFFVCTVILGCMYPLTFMQYTLKWDAIDISLPWRYFVCDAIHNGLLPLWNPFQFHGFAQGMEPQTWYPLALLCGLTNGYDLVSLNLEYLVHLCLGAWGFVRLAKYLNIDFDSACIGAIIFCLSGFFVANSQHLGWIIAGTWIPHVVASYGNFLRGKNWRHGVGFVIGLYMLLSGGYIAYSIIVSYILAFWGLAHLVSRYRQDRSDFREDILAMLRILVLIPLVCGAIFLGFHDLHLHVSRADGLDVAAGMIGSNRISHLLSLLFPAATLHETSSFWRADQSLINHYIGIPGLVLLAFSLGGLRTDVLNRRLWLLAIVSLLLSWGEELPLRQWLNVLPGFGLFRFPSLFRYFFILCAALLAARSLKTVAAQRSHPTWVRLLAGLSILYFVSGLAMSKAGIGFESLRSAIFSHSIIGLVLVLLCYLVVALVPKVRARYLLLMFVVALDFFIFLRLNGSTSVLSEHPLATLQQTLKQLPQGYPLPPLHDLLQSNPDRSLQKHSIYRNTNMLYKRIGWDGYTPYQYSDFLALEESPSYDKIIRQGPLIMSSLDAAVPGTAYFPVSPDRDLVDQSIRILHFDPNSIALATTTTHPRLLVYNQNFHPAWKTYVDEERVPTYKAEMNLLAIHLMPGEHNVRFEFNPGALVNALWISGVAFLLCLIVLAASSKHYKSLMALALLTVLLIAIQKLVKKSNVADLPETPSAVILNEYHALAASEYQPRDRFLDAGDQDRLEQYQFDHPGAVVLGHPIQSSPSARTSVPDILGFCNFSIPVQNWTRSADEIYIDDHLNPYQRCRSLEYSATFETALEYPDGDPTAQLKVSLDVRGFGVASAQLVLNVVDPDGDEQWRALPLSGTNITPQQWRQVHMVETVTRQPNQVLKVYVWNPGGEDLEIDNFTVVMEE